MIAGRRVVTLVALLALWAVALADAAWPGRTLAAFVVIFLAPGFLLDAALGRDAHAASAEAPARALALSIGLVGLVAAAGAMLGLPISVLSGAIAVISMALALLASPASALRGTRAPGSTISQAGSHAGAGGWSAEERAAAISLIVLTAAAAVLAALDVNISRDRMWYGAYVIKLSSGGAIDWSEPMLGSGGVAWRFAHNAWIAALAAWHGLLGSPGAPELLERSAPPLLVALLPSAAFAIARALLPGRGAAAIVALCSVVVLLASGYPYFSPERYAFFARIVEDKTAALVLLAPVASSLGIDALGSRARPTTRELARFALALVATALTHAIVFFVVCLALAVYAATSFAARRSALANAVMALTICTLVAIAPATLGMRARHGVLAAEDGHTHMLIASPSDPIVRAHLRMQRLRDIGTGGPIVEPSLLADPLLLVALLGLAPALRSRRTAWAMYALTTSAAFLALAFLPFLAPAFGRLVVPWMAYRALWGIPFGLLFGALVLAILVGARARLPKPHAAALAVTIVVAIAVLGASRLPWQRIGRNGERLTQDAETRAVLDAISTVAPDARIAAAPGLAELVPAYTGRPVLGFSDRGTAAFAGSRELAERRLLANAVIVGLRGSGTKLRRALIDFHGVTHVVHAGGRCDLGMTAVFSSPRFVLCEAPSRQVRPPSRQPREPPLLARTSGTRHVAFGTPAAVAALGDGLECKPSPLRDGELFRWRRHGRWSGELVNVTCTAKLTKPARVRGLRVRAHLPRAREALVFHARARGHGRRCRARVGAVELTADTASTIALTCDGARTVTVRLVPALLPYLNLIELEVLGEPD